MQHSPSLGIVVSIVELLDLWVLYIAHLAIIEFIVLSFLCFCVSCTCSIRSSNLERIVDIQITPVSNSRRCLSNNRVIRMIVGRYMRLFLFV